MDERIEVTYLSPYGWDSETFESWDKQGAADFFHEHRPASMRQGVQVIAVRH